MPQATPNIEKIDEYLSDVVRGLHGAVRQGFSHAQDAPVIDRAIRDSEDILEVIMEGDVQSWLQ